MSEQIGSDEIAVEEMSSTPLATVGEQLAAARQARGLAVLDIDDHEYSSIVADLWCHIQP